MWSRFEANSYGFYRRGIDYRAWGNGVGSQAVRFGGEPRRREPRLVVPTEVLVGGVSLGGGSREAVPTKAV